MTDIEITPEVENYLAAFDNWLHTVWKRPPLERPRTDAATDLKAAALSDLVRGRAPLTVAEELRAAATCPECLGPVLREVVAQRGQPRVFCQGCRPGALHAAA